MWARIFGVGDKPLNTCYSGSLQTLSLRSSKASLDKLDRSFSKRAVLGGSAQTKQGCYSLNTRHLEKVTWALDQMTVKIILPARVSFSAAGPQESLKMSGHLILNLLPPPQHESRLSSKSFFNPCSKVRNQRAPALSGSQNAAGLTQPRIGTGSMPLSGPGCSQITLMCNQRSPLRWQAPEPAPNLGIHRFHVIRDWIEHFCFNRNNCHWHRNKKPPVPKGQSHRAGEPSLKYGMVPLFCASQFLP